VVLPQERLPHHRTLCVWPSSRAPSHSLPLPVTGTKARHLSLFLRWTDATRFSLSNTRFRSPLPPPTLPPILQLSEFEELYPSTLRVRGIPVFTPSSQTSQEYDGSVRTLACIVPRPSVVLVHPAPSQRHMNPYYPSTTIDHLAKQHTFLLADLEVSLPQHETTISALRQQFEAHIRFLRINLESYISRQLSITDALHEQQPSSDPVQATAFPRMVPLLRSAQRTNNRHLQLLG
jgi:hypothetical protein